MGIDKQKSSNNKLWIRIVLGLGTVFLIVACYCGYHLFQSYRLYVAIKDELKKMNTVGPKNSYKKLPMVSKYHFGELGKKLETLLYKDDNKEFIAELLPASDESKKQAVISDIEKLTQSLAYENYGKDWSTAVENLRAPQPKALELDGYDNVNYRETRTCCQRITALARYHALKGENEKAIRLLMCNLSLYRQFLSFRKANGGVILIDAMIAVAIIRTLNRVLVKQRALESLAGNLFPLVKERLEEVDSLFPLVGPSLSLERTLVPTFFERFNKAATKSYGRRTVVVDEAWLKEKLDYFYPPADIYEKPYAAVKEEFAKYNKRLNELTLKSDYSSYIKGIFSPFKLVAWTLLAISTPNYSRAYERECETRSELRGIYLSFAIHHFKEQNGEFPGSLEELKPYIKEEMATDFVTGKEFFYRRKFDKVRLESKQAKDAVIFLK